MVTTTVPSGVYGDLSINSTFSNLLLSLFLLDSHATAFTQWTSGPLAGRLPHSRPLRKGSRGLRESLCRTSLKIDLMAPSYGEAKFFTTVRIPNFGRRYVWATDRRLFRIGRECYSYDSHCFFFNVLRCMKDLTLFDLKYGFDSKFSFQGSPTTWNPRSSLSYKGPYSKEVFFIQPGGYFWVPLSYFYRRIQKACYFWTLMDTSYFSGLSAIPGVLCTAGVSDILPEIAGKCLKLSQNHQMIGYGHRNSSTLILMKTHISRMSTLAIQARSSVPDIWWPPVDKVFMQKQFFTATSAKSFTRRTKSRKADIR